MYEKVDEKHNFLVNLIHFMKYMCYTGYEKYPVVQHYGVRREAMLIQGCGKFASNDIHDARGKRSG